MAGQVITVKWPTSDLRAARNLFGLSLNDPHRCNLARDRADGHAPVPAQVIDKGIPTAGLLAHVMVAKFADHLPLYRQEKIFGRAGLAIAGSTLAQWVGQTGVRLQPLVERRS